MKTKEEMLTDINLSIELLKKTKEELEKVENACYKKSTVDISLRREYSLNRIARNCITVRDLLNNIRKGCQFRYDK